MRIQLAFMFIGLASFSLAEIFSTKVFTTFNAATSNAQGHTGVMGTAAVGVMTPDPNRATLSIRAVTIHGLKARRPGSLSIYMTNTIGGLYLHDAGFGQGQVDGDITFIPGAATNKTFAEKIASVGSSVVIGNSTFSPQGQVVSIGVPSIRDYRSFVGPQSGWLFLFTNSDRTFGGSFTGISVDAVLAPVPEPATMIVMIGGVALLLRRRRG